jgi:hypothetical protein
MPRSRSVESLARKVLCSSRMTENYFLGARSMEAPSLLERLIPVPQRREREHVDLAAAPERIWKLIRHADIARTPVLRALVRSRVLPGTSPSGKQAGPRFCIDDLRPSAREPGFQLLADEPPRQFTVGALARANRLRLSFLDFRNIDEFIAFAEPGAIKLAWSAQIAACGSKTMGDGSRLSFELRIGATDAGAWRMARWYLGLIGPGMHWAQRRVLGSLADDLGWPQPRGRGRPVAAIV